MVVLVLFIDRMAQTNCRLIKSTHKITFSVYMVKTNNLDLKLREC